MRKERIFQANPHSSIRVPRVFCSPSQDQENIHRRSQRSQRPLNADTPARRHADTRFLKLAFAALTLILALSLSPANAADQSDPTVRLREMLRTTILQLRQAQTDNAALQAAQAESAAKLKDLTDKLETITKQSAADKEASDKTIADLKAHVADQDTQIAQLKDALAKWQDGYKKAADIANAKESERAKLAMQVILLQRKVDDREAKNAELFRIGNEILSRYERFGLGTALAAREPFVGITRVKLENQVQDYQDKLLDQKISPGQPVPTPTPAAKGGQQKPESAASSPTPG